MTRVPGRGLANATGLYLEGIRDGNPREAVSRFTGDRYTQHSTGVRDGADGFIEFFESFLARNPTRRIEIVRSLEDGRHAFLHVYQSLNDGESRWVTMDFFDTDEASRVIEHWDVIAPYVGPTVSGHTQVDGATEVTDLGLTEANKSLVRNMIAQLQTPGGDVSAVGNFIHPEYVEHRPGAADGLDGFAQLLTPEERRLWYREVVLLLGEGNFVATLCRAEREGREYAQADLFRVEGGLIAEHWDAAELVPRAEDLVNRGKF